jgi:hypothetical protein
MDKQFFFSEGRENEVIQQGPPKTKLTAYFECVQFERRADIITLPTPTAMDIPYADFARYYAWKSKERKWSRRTKRLAVISRLYTQQHLTEAYYFRMLLYRRTNIASFLEMRTVNGAPLETYKDVCIHFGLLADDKEWQEVFREAIDFVNAATLRKLFATMLVHNSVQSPKLLFEEFKKQLSDDFVYNRSIQLRNRNLTHTENDYSEALWQISDMVEDISNHSTTILEKGMEYPIIPRHLEVPVNRDLAVQLAYNQQEQHDIAINRVQLLNADQRLIYDSVMARTNGDYSQSNMVFVDAPGGTGKTFLFNTILASVRGQGKVAIAVASSAIAAQLLEGGCTAHKRFRIPLKPTKDSFCKFSRRNNNGQTLLEASIVIWDEAPMQSKWVIEAVDRTMRKLFQNDIPFGGVVFIFGGDFRQVLPVLQRGSRSSIISLMIKQSFLWENMTKFSLTINERVRRFGMNAQTLMWSNYLLAVGEGREKTYVDITENTIKISDQLIHTSRVEDFIRWCYPTFDFSSEANCSTAILAPRNEDVDKLNECAIDMFTGDTITILSADNIKIQDSPGEAELYPVEYLNTITPSGFPSHELKLKIGCPVILLRNIDVSEGLCNGTRLIVKRISRNQKLLICIFASGVRKNEEVVIPRINLDTEENLLPFIMTRRQFPIRLAFAMTINKAQGQTLKKVGIYLNAPVFSHGQLYVALSRTGDKSSVKIFMNEIKNRQGKIENRVGWFTDNIVYGEALSN